MRRLLISCRRMTHDMCDSLYDEEEASERSDASFSFNPFRVMDSGGLVTVLV